MRKFVLALAAIVLLPVLWAVVYVSHAHAQSALDTLANCKHEAEAVARYESPRYRQIVLACMRTETDRIEARTSALNAYAARLREHGYGQ